ncbi:MAG: thiolase family protein [Sphingomonadaceae bacterium]|nr:thiolase family protein [Sphingomonadaceae bacterium]
MVGNPLAGKAAISGIGRSRIERKGMTPPMILLAEAFKQALDDAGLVRDDIDGVCTYPGHRDGRDGMAPVGSTEAINALGLKVNWYQGGPEGAAQSSALMIAALAVATGQARHVLVFRCLNESSAQATGRRGIGERGGASEVATIGGWLSWLVPLGASSAVNWAAMYADRIMHEHGLTREQLGAQAVFQRECAQHDPGAIMHGKPLTMADYLSSRMISDPLCLFDCDVPIDGAACVIVSTIEAARDCKRPPLRIEAIGAGLEHGFTWHQRPDLTTMGAHDAAASMWATTDLKPSDVDVAGLYDGFSIFVPMWLEALGFCGLGEGGPFIGSGATRLDGAIPTNTNGGQLSSGRLHGYGLLWEVCTQLRGDGGARQVKDARVGVVGVGGGPIAGTVLLARE